MNDRLPRQFDHTATLSVHFARERAPGAGMVLEKDGRRFCIRCCADKPQKGGRLLPGGLFACAGHVRVKEAA
jgi:hypothetical protein